MDIGREWLNRMYFGDCIKSLDAMPEKFVNTCVTSPPYFGLRDYGSGKWVGGDPAHKHDKDVTGPNRITSVGIGSGDRDFQQNLARARKKKQVGRNDVDTRYPAKEDAEATIGKHDVHQSGSTCSCGAVYVDEQIGQEKTPEEFIASLVGVFRAVRRVLRDDGTIWVNIGDSYAGNNPGYVADAPSNKTSLQGRRNRGDKEGKVNTPTQRRLYEGLKNKDLIGIPWMLAFALRADGWYLRSDIIWAKPSCMPESIKDRPTKSHEYIFLLSKSEKYYFDMDAIMEPSVSAGQLQKFGSGKKMSRAYANNRVPSGNERPDAPPITIGEMRHKRSVWTVSPKGYSGAHFATYPEELIEPCVLAGAPARGVVLDPFMGSGTTAAVAARLERYWVGCELNESNNFLQQERLGRTWLYEPESPARRQRVRLAGDRVRL